MEIDMKPLTEEQKQEIKKTINGMFTKLNNEGIKEKDILNFINEWFF